MGELNWTYLGRVPYEKALSLQLRLRESVRRGERPDTLLLLEHDPVVTLGRCANSAHVLVSKHMLNERGIALVQTERGGGVTFHGPGQLVGYPIRRIGRAIRAHVEGIMTALERYVRKIGIDARWDPDSPGLWTSDGKIAAVGVDARGGAAMHGFSLNLNADLRSYELIVPCGETRPVVSVRSTLGHSPAIADAARDVAATLAEVFDVQLHEVDPNAFDLEECQ